MGDKQNGKQIRPKRISPMTLNVYKQIVQCLLTMPTKSSKKYASIDVQHVKEIESKKSARKNVDTKLVSQKNNRRSQSLDRLDDNSGDSREDRRNRRQFMHLVCISQRHFQFTIFIEAFNI